MHITKPHHGETRTLWYVYDGDNCVATLELGQVYRYTSGGEYRLTNVVWNTGYVTVERNGNTYLWHVKSLLAGRKEVPCPTSTPS